MSPRPPRSTLTDTLFPCTTRFRSLTSSVPPAGSLAALQSPSGDRGASVPPGAVVLQVACVFRPEIGTWTPLYHPTNGEAFSLILTSPAWKSERIPNSISVTFSGANDWNRSEEQTSELQSLMGN